MFEAWVIQGIGVLEKVGCCILSMDFHPDTILINVPCWSQYPLQERLNDAPFFKEKIKIKTCFNSMIIGGSLSLNVIKECEVFWRSLMSWKKINVKAWLKAIV